MGKPHLKEINEREESFTSGASINVSVVHALSNETCRTVAYVPSDGESEYYNKQIVVNGQAFDKFHEIGWENKFTCALNKKQFNGNISVTEAQGHVVNVELSVAFKKTSGDWFKDNIRACIPPHIVL